jgi:hypothetical protein
MSDYLSNLILRSSQAGEQNPTNLFRPRLPSLFEAPRTADQFSIPEFDRQDENPDQHDQFLPQEISLPNTISPKAFDESIEPGRTIRSKSEKRFNKVSDFISERYSNASNEQPKPSRTEATNLTHKFNASLNTTEREEAAARMSHHEIDTAQQALHFTPSRSKSTPIVFSHPMPAVSHSLPIQIEHTEAPASIIHVHIGRIEVRAVSPLPSTSIRKTGSQSPNLTLDDYLRQRNEGKR